MNIINAIINVVQNPISELVNYYQSRNRVNLAGDALENYVQDLFSGAFYLSESERIQRHSEVFSYLGNNSNPPDMMLKNGDAIEVKKIESPNSALALNSSYPKAKLLASSPMISTACKNAETWQEKDLIYVVGVVNKQNELKHLCMVYGEDYCADEECYLKISEDLDFKLNQIGIDNFSLSCFSMKNPFQVFDDIYQFDNNAKFNFMALINDSKWDLMENSEMLYSINSLKIKNVILNNSFCKKQVSSAKLITFSC